MPEPPSKFYRTYPRHLKLYTKCNLQKPQHVVAFIVFCSGSVAMNLGTILDACMCTLLLFIARYPTKHSHNLQTDLTLRSFSILLRRVGIR